jgi:hypothetical protein
MLPSWCLRETLWYYGVVIVNQVVRGGRALDGSENSATSKPEAHLSVLLELGVHSSKAAHAILANKMPVVSQHPASRGGGTSWVQDKRRTDTKRRVRGKEIDTLKFGCWMAKRSDYLVTN